MGHAFFPITYLTCPKKLKEEEEEEAEKEKIQQKEREREEAINLSCKVNFFNLPVLPNLPGLNSLFLANKKINLGA